MEPNKDKFLDGEMYRVCDVGYTKFYYGSTIQPLSMRMGGHRDACRRYKARNAHKSTIYDLFDEFGSENCKIELVEAYPCDNRNELLKREGYHIQQNECVNKIVVGRTPQEQRRLYRLRNKANHINKDREYNLRHRLEIARQGKVRYENNEEDIAERSTMNMLCALCGACYTRGHAARHTQSKKHQEALKHQEPETEP